MVIYVGCLLIYRPFVTILILSASFWGFYRILLTYQNGLTFQAQEVVVSGVARQFISGDSVNYVTFLISLTTICFAIYHGRLNKAKKATALEKGAKEDPLTGMYNYRYFTELAKDNIQSLTEDVETEAQAQFLNKIGCTRLQGYLFGKPIPKEAFYQRIDRGELQVSDHCF